MANPYPPDLQMACDVPSMFGPDSDGADKITMVGRVMKTGLVNSVEFIPSWTLAGANTNSRTYTLYNRGSAGAGTTAVATLALTSGTNLTKFVTRTLTITPANATIAVGDILEFESLHVGTGLPDVGGRLIVQQSFAP